MRTLIGLAILSLTACTFVQDRYPTLPPGPYRGVLELVYNPVVPNPKGAPTPELQNLEFDEVTEGELPFTFEVEYLNDTSIQIKLFNGDETIVVPAENIGYGRDISQSRDTLRIDFPVYDTHISAYHEENVIEGVWVVHYKDNYRIPFVARYGQDHRFTVLDKEPAADLSGRWAVTFSTEDDPYPGLAEFEQTGNELTGTFRTETGDYRYLAGTVQEDKAYLSVFDGSHAFLFEAIIKEDGSLSGSFRSGRHYITDWTATRAADDYELANPDSLTSMVTEEPLDFSFQTSAGRSVSISDEAFDGKIKLIQIFGTWCPNCRDETNFLRDWLADYAYADQVAIIGLGFERYGLDDPRSFAALDRYRQHMDVSWPLLLAGPSSKSAAADALPQLNHILSYPTLLFVDRDNRVRRIHTGFNGPATSKYQAFIEEFEATMAELIGEES
ncbi:MAG: TlpA disulfide reductase family protein [Bacteroidota bacterium]